VKRKYRLLFSSSKNKPGPKGPSKELIAFILQLKQRNPGYGCPKIALVVENYFGIKMSEDTVRRILRMHLKPLPGKGPSWLTFIGHTKDSLWSIDFFRVESIFLRSYWVMVVMDQFSRRIVGVAVRKANLDGPVICQLFQEVLQGSKVLPKYLSSDHDPLFKYHRWQSNLRILEINEIKTVPMVPISHPFIERLIGTLRRELLDFVLFSTKADLEKKLLEFIAYYDEHRVHSSLGGLTPVQMSTEAQPLRVSIESYGWKKHCHGFYQTPVAA